MLRAYFSEAPKLIVAALFAGMIIKWAAITEAIVLASRLAP